MWRRRVMTTPQGTGAPTNLWPETETEPIGLAKVTIGARRTKGIIIPKSAPSQWMKKRDSSRPAAVSAAMT